MNFDNNHSTLRENKGYRPKQSSDLVRKQKAEEIDSEKYKEAERERKRISATIQWNEKGYTQQLVELGKLCCFVEFFDKIPLEEQQIEQVGPFENPRECESFKKGYETGKIFVNNGFTEENYHVFVNNYENKYLNNNKKNK